jgi:hypothetical protein
LKDPELSWFALFSCFGAFLFDQPVDDLIEMSMFILMRSDLGGNGSTAIHLATALPFVTARTDRELFGFWHQETRITTFLPELVTLNASLRSINFPTTCGGTTSGSINRSHLIQVVHGVFAFEPEISGTTDLNLLSGFWVDNIGDWNRSGHDNVLCISVNLEIFVEQRIKDV